MTVTSDAKHNTYVGIDYSMSSPAIAIYRGDPKHFHWKEVEFHYFTKIESLAKDWETDSPAGSVVWCRGYAVNHTPINNEMRFMMLARWALHVIAGAGGQTPKPDATWIGLEDYAMGAKGRVFEIAENTGCLKQLLRAADFSFDLIAPTALKKFATGKGNADKDKMYAQWMEETKFDIWKIMTPGRGKISSPVTDIVDAYYLLKKIVMENQ
jgi:hypothetical protein